MTSYRIARRAFLRSCGATTTLFPLLRSIEANAQGLPAPRRFLVIHHPLGTQLDLWRPAATATTTTFTLPYNSAPFEPLRSKMVLVDGLNIISATRTAGVSSGDRTHEGGVVAVMTGQPTLGKIGREDHASGGRSIDQIFLDQSPLLGGLAVPAAMRTPFGSIQLAADVRSDRDEVSPRVLSYRDPDPGVTDISQARKPMYPETQPLNTFMRIFGGQQLPVADVARATALLMQQRSVLDFMRSDLARMRTLIPASETMKLSQYEDSVRQLESSIEFSLRPSACVKPGTPMSFTQSGMGASGTSAPVGMASQLTGVDYYDAADAAHHPHQDLGRLQLQMIKFAFACDLVRVATFMWSAGTNWVVFPRSFGGALLTGSGESSPHHPPTHTTDPNTVRWVAAIDRWYAEQNAAAITEFDQATDVDGNTLLDNTTIAYVSEVARAYDHDFYNVPFAVFGGKNTRLAGGTYLKVMDGRKPASTSSVPPGGNPPATNRPLNDAWLALAPSFGVDMTSLGAATQFESPLPGLLKP